MTDKKPNKSSNRPSTPHRASQGNRDFRKRTQRNERPAGESASPARTVPVHANAGGQAGIFLKEGREKSLQRRHPWIFSGGIERIDGAPASGDTVPVRDANGQFLAWAAYNAGSQITARLWSLREDEMIDADFFRR